MKKTGSEFTLLIGRRTECEYKIHFFFGEIDVVTGIFFDSLHIRSNRLAHAGRIFRVGNKMFGFEITEDKPGTAFAVFNTLAANNINVDIILQSVGREGTKDISFTVASEDLQHAIEVLNANKERLTIQDITWNEKVAKLSIVGAGMMSNPGVAAKMFESLYNSRVNINMISTSEIRITVLIPEEDIEKAMNAVHDGFGLGA